MSHTQFKLSDGVEIICQVVEEPEGDDVNIVVRHCMTITTVDQDDGFRYYSFRPWMVYQDHKDFLQLLNYTQIVGEAKPSPFLLEQYKKAVDMEHDNATKREDEVSERFSELLEVISGMDCNDSDDENNIVTLFRLNPSKMH